MRRRREDAQRKVKASTPAERVGLSDSGDIIRTIEAFFEIGRTKDLASLRAVQLDDPRFSSFGDVPPYGLKDFDTTVALEELRFVGISDYDYDITGPKISVFGNVAVAAFGLTQRGMLVDNKAFTGEHVVISNRATFVLVKLDASSSSWKIAHIHLSRAGDR